MNANQAERVDHREVPSGEPGVVASVARRVMMGLVLTLIVVPPAAGYLEGLRELCDRHGALLLFDEVMTGFRVAAGSAQGLYSVKPDITCLGKIIGGGLPVGAYGGRAELMNQVAPAGPIYQAGTLSGNPLSMAAGIATLTLLEDPNVYTQLETLGARLEAGLMAAAQGAGCR